MHICTTYPRIYNRHLRTQEYPYKEGMRMNEGMTESVYPNDGLFVSGGGRDGFHEQIVILNRLSEELEIYFSL